MAAGLFTRVTALFPAFAMTVAAFGHHRLATRGLALLGLAEAPPPLRDGCRLELAVVYLLVLVGIALLGPGRLSLDGWRERRRTPSLATTSA